MAPTCSFLRSPNTVCVIDASGEVGLSLVKRLLRRGYTVHATSQIKGDEFKIKGLSVDEDRRLRVFYSDPFDYQSILNAMKGCSGLFYTFEPPRDQPTYDEYMVEEEVRAAHNVLEACAQTETMEKVVYTSSITAVVWNESRGSSATDVSERNWSEPNFCRKFKLWHALAKTLAEKTAWALAMDRDVSMVTINAGLLVSSELTIAHPYLQGAREMYEDGVFVTVDAEFLASAHICAYEDVSAYGRYLCFNQLIVQDEDAVKLSQMLLPSAPCPPPPNNDTTRIIKQRIHNSKLKEMMEDFDGGMVLQDDMEFLDC